jgi:N-acylneuraminate cytidylyltransferase
MSKYVGLICARGGSKGVPGKNIRLLGGHPLIAWAIKTALEVEEIERVIVSTDSEEIAEIAKRYGGEVPFLRPTELAQDNSPEWAVWQHALHFLHKNHYEVNGLVVIPPTAPLRTKGDIERCLREFENTDADIVITVSDSHRNPYFNMVKKDVLGDVGLVIPPYDRVFRRQDVPQVFDMTTVAYVAKPSFVLSGSGIFDGRVRCVPIPLERAIDIDTELDLKIADFLISLNHVEK